VRLLLIVSPAQLNRRSAAALAGRGVLSWMNSFLTVGRTLPKLAECLYITTNRCVCKHYTASRPVLLLFCNTLEKSKSKSTQESTSLQVKVLKNFSTSLQVKSIQVVLKYCDALLLLRYRTTLGIIRPIIVLSEALPHTNALTSEHT
jgi:hypothetical protein